MKHICSNCKEANDTSMKTCKNCGENLISQKNKGYAVIGGGLVLVCFFAFLALYSGEETNKNVLSEGEIRNQKIQECFSGWDGSHINLTNLIKESLNDSDSYKHIETTYIDKDSILIIKATFSAKNGFGGTIKQTVLVESNMNCDITNKIQWIQ